MRKKRKTSKSKLIKKKEKPNFLNGLKELTNWIVYSNNNINTLENLIQTYNFDEYIFKRLLSYVYFYPHLIHYWNEYMNNLFDWSKLFGNKIKKRENLVKLINSFAYTLVKNNCCDKHNFMFIKGNLYQDKNRRDIKKLMKEYFQTINGKNFNDKELNFYYDLFCLNQITDVELMKADQLLNGGKSTINISNINSPQLEIINQVDLVQENINIQNTEHSIEIKNFIKNVKLYKETRTKCKSCGLYKSPMIVLDTNIDKPGKVDIAFIGLNPGKKEIEEDKPFVGLSGTKLRKKMALLPTNIKWLISNIVLCHTVSEKEIPKDAFNNCIDMFKNICEAFPADYYVFIGRQAAQIAGVKDKITKVSGNIYNDNIIPIIHPSSLRSQEMIDIWDNSFDTIYKLFNVQKSQLVQLDQSVNNQQHNFNIPQHKIITQVTDDLSLFDVKEVNKDKIVKIFIDNNGEKKYLFEDYNLTVNVKHASFTNCDMITKEVDSFVKIKGSNKYFISKMLNNSLKDLKKL